MAGFIHTIKSFAKKHPGVTEGSLRWMIFNSKTNGLAESGALIRVGRRVLLDEALFLEWLRSGSAKQEA